MGGTAAARGHRRPFPAHLLCGLPRALTATSGVPQGRLTQPRPLLSSSTGRLLLPSLGAHRSLIEAVWLTANAIRTPSSESRLGSKTPGCGHDVLLPTPCRGRPACWKGSDHAHQHQKACSGPSAQTASNPNFARTRCRRHHRRSCCLASLQAVQLACAHERRPWVSLDWYLQCQTNLQCRPRTCHAASPPPLGGIQSRAAVPAAQAAIQSADRITGGRQGPCACDCGLELANVQHDHPAATQFGFAAAPAGGPPSGKLGGGNSDLRCQSATGSPAVPRLRWEVEHYNYT